MGVKRWLAVVFLGELALALAGAFVLRQVYRDVELSGPIQGILYVVTLQPLPYLLRGVVLAVVGGAVFLYGSYRVIRAIMAPFRGTAGEPPLVEVIYRQRSRSRGPRIVAIGGGTGLSVLLRGLKEHTSNLTAVVTVADDGGSSGKLRQILGIPPVGDIRNCLVALADAEPLMGELLQYRFPVPAAPAGDGTADGTADGGADRAADGAASPDPPAVGPAEVEPGLPLSPETAGERWPDPDRLGGHAVGNLVIAAMTAILGGDFEEGVRQMNRVLAVRGQVLPASSVPLTLHARLQDGTELVGQSRIARAAGIHEVWLSPPSVPACTDALAAIAHADAIVIGPGSLFTSILPALLIPEIRNAVLTSPALRIYVCNVATQVGETSGFDLADHVEALERHTAPGLVDVVLANNRLDARAPQDWRAEPVRLRWPPATALVPRLVLDDVVDPDNAHHHDPARLAAAVLRIVEREAGSHRRTTARTA
jgi:uncharacterized cofD-like protein